MRASVSAAAVGRVGLWAGGALPAYAKINRSNAPMPNIENLRKRAKLYLRWRRERYYPVAAQIRLMLARFRDLTDKDVLEADFKLSDAQELVARQHGFESWPALIKGIEAMTASADRAANTSVILAAEPQLFVSDIETACRFYVEKLGFKIAFSYGEPAFYAQVFRDGGRLNLRKVSGPVFDGAFRAREGDALSATLTLDDAKPLFLEFQKAGVTFRQSLRTEPWGARTFIVKDPDGNLICFAGGPA
jgi:catechol 2,3-dioxygenase-like lactoylglutathione lyase family enzyme